MEFHDLGCTVVGMRRTILLAALLIALPETTLAAPPAATTQPATQPVADLTLDQLVAMVPPAKLFPDRSGFLGGNNDATEKDLADWAAVNLVGRRVQASAPFQTGGNARGGKAVIVYGFAKVAAGKKRWPVVIQQNGRKQGTVSAAEMPTIAKLVADKDGVQIAGTITKISFDRDGLTIDVDPATATLTLPKK